MKNTIVFVLIIIGWRPALSQTFTVRGVVTDEFMTPVRAAMITIKGRDSARVGTVSGSDGSFLLRSGVSSIYYLSVQAPGFEEYDDTIKQRGASFNIGAIRLSHMLHELDEVKVVNKVLAMVQKDDTIEFNSGAYKVNPDADGVDLVRKMPAIEVNGSGITTQGEAVVKVLVDGKPFFGSDPFAALKNLPADIVDKVQVYNEKTDQEQFTGFSEGNTSKTINIITKADKRNGEFGSAYIGGGGDNGNDGRYGAGLTANEFQGDRRLTLTGQSNNINEQNFSDPSASGGGSAGTTTTNAGGINYNDKLSKSLTVSGSYFFSSTNTSALTDTRKLFLLPADSGEIYNQSGGSANRNNGHRVSGRIEYAYDSMNSLIWQPTFSASNGSATSQMLGYTGQGQEPINQTMNGSNSSHTGLNFGNSLLLRHRFRKKGETISADLRLNTSSTGGTSLHNAQDEYYLSPALNDTLNQQIGNNNKNLTAGGNVVYTLPAGEHGLFKADYSLSYMPSSAASDALDYSELTHAYSLPDSLYSNSFRGANWAQRAGASYMLRFGKCEMSLGANYQLSRLINNQSQPYNFSLDRTFDNVLPAASFRWKISKSRNLQCIYNTNTQAPGVGQLQNVINNTNPLFLHTGNPSLQQTYRHNLTLRYNATNAKSRNSFSASVSGNYTENGIVPDEIVARQDTFVSSAHLLLPAGSQLTMPVNISGASAINGNISYGLPIERIKCNLKFSINAADNHSPSIINGAVNDNDSRSCSAIVTLSSNISENVDFIVSTNTSVTSAVNSASGSLNTVYVNEGGNASLHLVFWKGFVLRTSVNVSANSGLSSGYNFGYTVWNMSIGKKVFHNKRGEVRISGYDLLNDNNNIQRTITDTYIQDTRTNTLTRYFLLVFNYKFEHFRKAPDAEAAK